MSQTWLSRRNQLNKQLQDANIPLRMESMLTVWTVLYDVPSRYNWMLQYYLRRHGIALSWVGTGRLIFNLAFTNKDFDEFCQRFIAAAQEMNKDGWWWTAEDQTNKVFAVQSHLNCFACGLK